MEYTYLDNIKAKIKAYGFNRWLIVVFDCLMVSAWTLIRFFNRTPNFDQVGQQVLAHQWLHGLHSGSVVGPTNYVLKMLFLYIPLDPLPLPAQFKLVFMTLLINIATFVLLIYALRCLYRQFNLNLKDSIYPALIYLALISGSAYWISYTNSRNLEVVGGLFLIYLYIRAQANPSRLYYGLLIILGGLLFFADPLQIYMTLLPAIIFVGLRATASRDRKQVTKLLELISCAAASILIAHYLTLIVEAVWNVSFISAKQSISFSLPSLKLALEQMAKLYGGGFEGGRLREAIDLLVVAGVIIGACYYAWRKPKARWLLSLVAIVWVVDMAVYIISGQAQQTDTNRYLIMTVPLFILALAAVLHYLPKKSRIYIVAFVLLFNTFSLALAFAKAWNPHFSQNNHSRAAITYLRGHKYTYGYASIGTALSSDYLSNWKVNVLPLGCDPDYILKKTNLFFDKAAFSVTQQSKTNDLIPVVLDGGNIKINQSACGTTQIEQQLGRWQKLDYLSDGSTVLLYQAKQLHHLRG